MNKKIKKNFEIEFYKKLLKQKPNFIDALIPLANAYTKSGEYEKGLEIDLKICSILSDDPVSFYNLACSYSLTKNIEKAIETLEKALKLGYNDFNYILQDPDLDNIKQEEKFNNLLIDYNFNL